MARPTSCAACAAKVPRGALFCPSCGHPLGLEIEAEAFETDDDLDRQPIVVEPERPHGLRNLAIAAAAVGIFVVGAVLVGRHDAKQPAADAGTTTTSSPRSSSTRPATSTTSTSTTIPPPSTSAWIDLVAKGPLLPEPTGIVLYSTTPNGRVVRLDVDTGGVTIRSPEEGAGDGVASQYFIRGSQLVVFRQDVGTALVVSADLHTQTQEIKVDNGSQIVRGPGDDELWVLTDPSNSQGLATQPYAQRIRLDGTPVGPRITLPGGVGDDGSGQLIYYLVNGGVTYALDPTTGAPTRVLDGLPLAIDHNRAVDLACDEHLTCHLRVTERATGKARLVPAVASSRLLDYGTGLLSPDGRWLAILTSPGDMLVVDLRDGSERQFDDAQVSAYWGQGPTWSPDGHWLFWTGGSHVYAWRAGSATAQTIGGGDLPELVGLVAAAKS